MRGTPGNNQVDVLRALLALTLSGGGELFGATWTPIAAGSTVTVVGSRMYAADSTGALTQFLLPSSPPNGTSFLVKLIGGLIINPMEFTAGAGDTIEDPQTPGTFSAPAGSVFTAVIGAIIAWKYDAVGHRWIQFIS